MTYRSDPYPIVGRAYESRETFMTSKQICQERIATASLLRLIGFSYRAIATAMGIKQDEARRYVAKGLNANRPSLKQRDTDPAPVGDDAELRDEERADAKRREEERREWMSREETLR